MIKVNLLRCIICYRQNPDKHHWKSKKSGGSDDNFNLMPLCRKHHSEFHQIGATTFADKYEQVKNWLLANGWEFNEFKKKWTHW